MLSYLHEWFIQRTGLAYGVLTAGESSSLSPTRSELTSLSLLSQRHLDRWSRLSFHPFGFSETVWLYGNSLGTGKLLSTQPNRLLS